MDPLRDFRELGRQRFDVEDLGAESACLQQPQVIAEAPPWEIARVQPTIPENERDT
jgi:hypothetical protein